MNTLGKIGVLTAAFALATGIWYACSPRFTSRQAVLKVVRGKVVDAHVTPGVKWDANLPHIDYPHMNLSYNETEFTVTPEDKQQKAIRLANTSQIFGGFATTYQVDNTERNFGDIFMKLKIDNQSELEKVIGPKINDFVLTAAIDIYKKIPYEEMNQDIDIGKKIKELAQKYLNDIGLNYIKIVIVLPRGVGLSKDANEQLDRINAEKRKLELLDAQDATANKAEQVALNQTKAPVAAIEAYKKAGLNDEQALQAYWIQMLNASEKVGVPGVIGPRTGGNLNIGGPK